MNYSIVTHILVFILGFSFGCVTKRYEKASNSILRNAIAIAVVSIWTYRLYAATVNPLVALTVWENLIMGIVVGAFFKPTQNVTTLLKSKLLSGPSSVTK